MGATATIRTPDQRLRVFVSSTLEELAAERRAVRRGVERLHLSPVMFELGARPHAPRQLYRAYLEQSQVFIGIYWQRYGWVAPGEDVSGLEDEYRLAGDRPQLIYIKEPAPEREPRLEALLDDVRTQDRVSYRRFAAPEELEQLVADDLAVLLSERFDASRPGTTSLLSAPPVPLTPTIGRDADVASVDRLLREGARLVTLTGTGGVGKTRLALEAARVLGDWFGGAIHFVPLAAVAMASQVMSTVADRLGIRLGAARSATDAVATHFGGRRSLLVLDNLEQVVDVGADLATLLGLAPGLQVLATSRQALRVRGERELVVAPLPVPSSDLADVILDSPAVRMFVDRARAVDPMFALTADNADAVAELCRELEGLPLALELAAGHVRLLSPQELLRRLRNALDLQATAMDVPARQQTLRATMDWSHDLLDERERALFARIGVFAGGATLEAIEEVCVDADVDVIPTLAGLLDKGLVVPGDDQHGTEPRLRMLAPVREYALERLDERGESARLRRGHLDYFSRLARRARPFLSGPEQHEWAARWDAERANVRAAVATGMEVGAVGAVLALVWDTFVYYYIRDAAAESRNWILEVAEYRHALDERQQAMLDVGLAVGGVLPADSDPERTLRAAADVLDRHGPSLEPAVAWHYLGLHQWQSGDVAGAIAALETSSRGYEAIGHDWGVASAEMTLGLVRAANGEPDRAAEHYRRSLQHSRVSESHPQVAQALQGLALIDALEGRVGDATTALEEATRIVLADRWATGTSYCLEALAAIAVARNAAEDAARSLGAAHLVRQRFGTPEWMAAAAVIAPVLDAARAKLGDDRFAELWHEGARSDPFSLLQDGVERMTAARRASSEAGSSP